MWQPERWPPLGLAVLACSSPLCAAVHAGQADGAVSLVPWRDAASFTESDDSVLEWLVTVKGTHVGTLGFSVLGGRDGALMDQLVRAPERGLAKVTFLEREVPAARVVQGSREQ